MRFIQHRTRTTYWSHSKLSKWIRTKFNLTNPSFLTMEGWNEHKKLCKQTSPFIHWLTDVGFNKLQNIWLFIPDLIYTIEVATIWKYFRNLYVFRKALWNYRSYDYSGLLMLMETATKDMHECHRDYGHHVGSDKTAKELLIVSTLLKRIREDEYMNQTQGWKQNEGELFGGEFYQIPNTLPSIESKKFYKMRERMRKDELELVCKIMSKKTLSWWD